MLRNFSLVDYLCLLAYRGRQAYRLFIQAYQLILWKQCHALVHKQGFPADIEVGVFCVFLMTTGFFFLNPC